MEDRKSIVVDGVEYVPASAAKPTGTRAVIVVDRGWIFAGDVVREHGRIRLSRAVWLFSWQSIGFAKAVETEKADIRPISGVDLPDCAEIFCIPVHDQWGLR